MICIKADIFQNKESFLKKMLIGIQKVKNLKLAKGFKEILYPGEPEYKSYIKNSKLGIPISKDVQLDLKKLAEKLNIKSIF
jgi:LDH2 family malate/lactate/ureidoglycolate dehydrogenase